MPAKRRKDHLISFEDARALLLDAVEQALAGGLPGPVRPLNQKSDDSYPLKLTQLQRDSLVHCTRLRPKLKTRLKESGDGTRVLDFTQKELEHLNEEVGAAMHYAHSPHKARLTAVLQKTENLLGEGVSDVFDLREHPATGNTIYQFKISLLEVRPVVWRRIQVPNCTLADFHDYIQAAMGWENYHLHQFKIHGENYGPPDPDGFGPQVKDYAQYTLANFISKRRLPKKWRYEYDFGDNWQHEIVFEGFPEFDAKKKYPFCLEGENACPPEDVGGPWGYAEFLEALADPNCETHEDMLEWSGPFDSKAFDPKKATREMRKVNR